MKCSDLPLSSNLSLSIIMFIQVYEFMKHDMHWENICFHLGVFDNRQFDLSENDKLIFFENPIFVDNPIFNIVGVPMIANPISFFIIWYMQIGISSIADSLKISLTFLYI